VAVPAVVGLVMVSVAIYEFSWEDLGTLYGTDGFDGGASRASAAKS
jgi:hypothetical protein